MAFRGLATVIGVGQLGHEDLEAYVADAPMILTDAKHRLGAGPDPKDLHYAVLAVECDEDTVRALGRLLRQQLDVKMVPR